MEYHQRGLIDSPDGECDHGFFGVTLLGATASTYVFLDADVTDNQITNGNGIATQTIDIGSIVDDGAIGGVVATRTAAVSNFDRVQVSRWRLGWSNHRSFDFEQFEQTEEGRFMMTITASNGGGALRLTSVAFGNSAGFTISQTANETGITDVDFRGVDVAGTLNGEAATCTGHVLTGNVGNGTSDGLAIRATIKPAQLIAQGQNRGSFTIIQGVGD